MDEAEAIKELILKFAICTNQDMSALDNSSFRTFLKCCRPAFAEYSWNTRELFENTLPNMYQKVLETETAKLKGMYCLRMLVDEFGSTAVVAGGNAFVGAFHIETSEEFKEALQESVSILLNIYLCKAKKTVYF